MKLTEINSFKELIALSKSGNECWKISRLIDEVYDIYYSNEEWIEIILDFLNGNTEDKKYSEYFYIPDENSNDRKDIYCFISTKDDMPISITDEEALILKKFNAQTKFILYGLEVKKSFSSQDFLCKKISLRKVLESIGITTELKEYLSELCFNRVKEEMLKKEQEKNIEQQKSVLSKENIELLFENHDFEYVLKAIYKCEENLNVELLDLISIRAQNLLSNPNANMFAKEQLIELFKKTHSYPCGMEDMNYDKLADAYNKRIVELCEDILAKIISICSDNYEHFGHILEQLYENKNPNVRLHCCGKGDYIRFLNDPFLRVAKVANIRYNFEEKWNSLSEDDSERKRIVFLMSAFKNREIGCFVYDVLNLEADDESFVNFTSGLFKKSKDQRRFDSDILYTINDRRILADAINELIKQGEIVLNYDMVPECFGRESSISQEKSGLILERKLSQPK